MAAAAEEPKQKVSIQFVDTMEKLETALKSLGRHRKVAFDTEGVDLGRRGALTVASFIGLDEASTDDDGDEKADYEGNGVVAFVIDISTLGGKRAFSGFCFVPLSYLSVYFSHVSLSL